MLTKYTPCVIRATYSTLRLLVTGPTTSVQSKSTILHQHNFAASQRFCSNKSAIGIVDYAEVKKLANEPQKLLIDVREPKELQETGQIPSSINIPLGVVSDELAASEQHFKTKYGRNKPKPDTEIVFHCRIGVRSLKAAEAAAALGFKNVKNYKGSWLDWAEREGLPK